MGKILTGTPNQPDYAAVRGADYVIAASDSPASWKSQASTVCGGTADEEQINYYAEKLTSGGLLLLAPGTFHVEADDSIHHLTPKTTFRGCGRLTKIVKDSLGTSLNIITCPVAAAVSDLIIEDMWLDLNDSAATSCFIEARGVNGLNIQRVYMYGGPNKMGRLWTRDCIGTRIIDCEMSYAERMYLESTMTGYDDTTIVAEDVLVQGCRLTDMESTDMAIAIVTSGVRVIGNFVDTGGTGIYVSASPDAVVEGNVVKNCSLQGIYGESGRRQNFLGNVVANCGTGISTINTGHISIATCGRNNISNNIIYNCTSACGIRVEGMPAVTVANNVIDTCLSNGIYLINHDTYYPYRCVITGNHVYNYGTTTASAAGIRLGYADYSEVTDNIIDGNNAVEADWGIADDGNSTNCTIENNTLRNINNKPYIICSGVGHVIRNNRGYIAKGERRTAASTLTPAASGSVAFYFQNPEKQDILIKQVLADITTASTDTTAAMSIGIADSSSGTNAGTEFFESMPTDAIGIYIADTAVLCEDSTSATDAYVVGIYTVEDSTKLAGSYHITYVGR